MAARTFKDRSQAVAANSTLSMLTLIYRGVPQGTILGPQQFLVVLSYIPSVIPSSTVTIYAHDAHTFLVVKDSGDSKTAKLTAYCIYK